MNMPEYRKIDKNTFVLRGVRQIKKLPEEKEKAYKTIIDQLSRGKEVWSKHKRVIVPKSSFEKLKEDFKPSRNWLGSIPEPGDKGSFRGPHGLHAHEYSNYAIIHQDTIEPTGIFKSIKHGLTEGVPAIPKGLFGEKILKEDIKKTASVYDGIFFSLTKSAKKIDDQDSSDEHFEEMRRLRDMAEGVSTVSSAPVIALGLGSVGTQLALLGSDAMNEKIKSVGDKALEQTNQLVEKYIPEFPKDKITYTSLHGSPGPSLAFKADVVYGKGAKDETYIAKKVQEILKNVGIDVPIAPKDPELMQKEVEKYVKKLPLEERGKVRRRFAETVLDAPISRNVVSQASPFGYSIEFSPKELNLAKSPAVSAHEIGHLQDTEGVARNMLNRGKYGKYIATLQNEFNASKNALKMVKDTFGTWKAVKSFFPLAGGFSTYLIGAMPKSMQAALLATPIAAGALTAGLDAYLESEGERYEDK